MNLNKLAAKIYLNLLYAECCPEQEPAHQVAKWYDLLWFLIPIIGFVLFVIIIEGRYKGD